jgi:hypothetical protein
VLQAENGRLSSGLVDYSVSEEGQGWKGCHAIVAQYEEEIGFHSAHNRGLKLAPECLVSMDGTEIEQWSGRIHFLEYGVADPIAIPLSPFS